MMPTYSYTYNVEVPEVDTTMTTNIALTCTTADLRLVNDFLARAKAVVAKGGPFVGEFQGLESIKGRTLPFTETKGRIEVRNHPLDATAGIINLLGCICSAVPGVGMNGKIYQVNAYFGKRVSYDVTRRPNQKAFDVVQHWNDVLPGDTYVPAPKITVVAEHGSAASSTRGKATATPAFLTPADVIRGLRKQEAEGHVYEPPKLRLVNETLAGEPDYVLPDNRFNPMALAWLIQSRAIDMSWGSFGGRRSWRFNFNDRTQENAPTCFANMRNEYGQAPFNVLKYLDEDPFFVPKEWMHPKLVESGILPRGELDMGGMLMLLGTGLWSIAQNDTDVYHIKCDERLWRGVPDVSTLLARLVWMLRSYAGYQGTFSIEVEPVHEPSLDDRVPTYKDACYGAPRRLSTLTLSVMDKPIPNLCGDATEHPFDGGLSSQPYGLFSTDDELQAYQKALHDEELFVRLLLDEIAVMPLTTEVRDGLLTGAVSTERMRVLPGDVLTLASSWRRAEVPVNGNVVGINAFTAEGSCVGALVEQEASSASEGPGFGLRQLACLLPYVTCVVRAVKKDEDEVPLVVELSFDTRGKTAGDIVHEVRRLMRDPYVMRSRLSRGPLMGSQACTIFDDVRDAQGHPRVPDEPNPAPRGLEAPQGNRPQLCENVLAFAGTETQLAPLINFMRANVLRPTPSISGWYCSEEELDQAATTEEVFQVLRSDLAERLPFVFRQKPSATYFREKHLLTMERVGKRLVLKIWFNTYDKPNNDDLNGFFRALPTQSLPMARVYKRADKREAHVLIDTFAKGKNSFGQMRRKERVANLDQLSKRYDELNGLGPESLGDLQLAEWAMLDEAFGNGAHKVFDTEHPVAEQATMPVNKGVASRYVKADGKVDAFMVAELLANDVVFFESSNVAWRMGKHVLKGMRINRAAAEAYPGLVNHAQDYAAGIADVLNTVERDEHLHVAKGDLHRSVRDALGDTDLTGMSLMQLMTFGHALWIVGKDDGELRESLAMRAGVNLATMDQKAQDGVYVIVCDDRILRAVPKAYFLLRRLVGALRAYNGLEGPHVEVIVAAHSESADSYLMDFKGTESGAMCDPVHIEGRLSQLTVVEDTVAADAR